jgi:hypothetical protein
VDDNELSSQITVLTPCLMSWDEMSGDDRVRHCSGCGKDVHDFAKMTAAEARSLLDHTDWDVCGRLSRGADGSILTVDHTAVAESTPGRWQFNIRSLMGVIAGLAATLGFARLFAEPTPKRQPPANAAAVRSVVMGKVCLLSRRSASSITAPRGVQPPPSTHR